MNFIIASFLLSTLFSFGELRRHQDKTVLKNLYRQMQGWNRNLKIDSMLEKQAQSLGCVRSHADHMGSSQDKKIQSRYHNMAAVIACSGGCRETLSNWSRSKPAQIFYDFKDRTGHYEDIMQNNRVGCSAKKSGDEICAFCYLVTVYGLG